MKARILIVENDAVTALDLEGLLLDADYLLTGVAASANEALKMAKGSLPDLVLLDIGLAGNVDGIELARRLQEGFSLAHVYISGHFEPAVLVRADQTGPLGYIVKPYKAAELLVGIEMAVCRNGQRCRAASSSVALAPFVVDRSFPVSRLARTAGDLCPMELRCSSLLVPGYSDGGSLAAPGTTVRCGATEPQSDVAAVAASWRPE